jgi:predicted phage tail protein
VEQTELSKSLSVIYQPHPVAPLAGRTGMVAVIDGTTSVRDVLLMAGIDPYQPITVQLDGEMLTIEEWDLICPTEGQMLNVNGTVQGGEGGSNAIMIVAMIAITIATYGASTGFFATAGGMFVAGSASAFALSAAISIGGTLLIGALFAPQAQSFSSQQTAQVSPTYSLSGAQNRARPYESMPVVMGSHRQVLDYGSKPFSKYQGEDQYLYQIFQLSLGNLIVGEYKIGTTPLTSFEDFEIIGQDSNGKLPKFPNNVDTASGAPLTEATGFVQRTTSINTYQIGLDFESILFFANDNGGLDPRSVDFEIEYKLSSDTSWIKPTSLALFGYGYSYNGVFLTGTGVDQKPIRVTAMIENLPLGTYDVRVKRVTADSTNSRETLNTNWNQIKSYQEDTAEYAGQNRIGLIIRASEQLNGVVQQLSVEITAQATYYNGTNWVTGVTENPAHWFMHFARGFYDINNKLVYGVGLGEVNMDLASLHAWAQFCAAEGLTFNAVIDGNQTAAEILNTISLVGFGSPTWASGLLGVVFDRRNPSPVMTFGMGNIIKDSFQVSYIGENLAEEIVVRFLNPEKDYAQDEVRTLAPEVTVPQRTSAVDLFGCTDADMAGKFANYLAAQQYYRRRRISWQSDFEGFVCQRGDVVLLSHDMTQWGYSGRVVSFQGTDANLNWDEINVNWDLANFEWDGEGNIVLDRDIPRNGGVEYFMLTRPDGITYTYEVEPATGESNVIKLFQEPDFQEGYATYDHRWSFSPLETSGKKVKIISVAPASDSRLQIVATDEYPEFYAAWDGVFVPPTSGSLLGTQLVNIANLTASSQATYVDGIIKNRITATWDKGGGVLYSRLKVFFRGVLVDEISAYSLPFYQFDTEEFGTFRIEITPYGFNGAGLASVFEFEVTELGSLAAPANLQLLVGEDGKTATFTWDKVLGASAYEIKIIVGGVPQRELNIGNRQEYTYTVDDAIADGGAFRNYTFNVYPATVKGISVNFSEVTFSNPQVAELSGITVTPLLVGIGFKCNRPIDADFKAIRIWLSTSSTFTPADNLIVYDGEPTQTEIHRDGSGNQLDPETVYYIRAAGYDSFGDDNLNISAVFSATSLSGVFALVEDSIGQELLDAGLRDEIDKIEPLELRIDVAETAITTEATIRQSADSALATQITTVSAIANGNTAAIQNEQTARVNADSALATEINALEVSVANNAAAIVTEQTVRANADSSLASSITTLQSTVNSNTSAIQNEVTARTTADSALSSSITTLQTTVNGQTTSIQTNATSIDGIEAKYTVKIDNNGYISGYGLISTANTATPTSTFSVLADRFVIANSATPYNTDTSIPFFVFTSPQVVDGVTIAAGTYIKKASIMDAAITNAKITNGAITNAKIGDAQITTAKIGTAQIDTLRVAGNAITSQGSASRTNGGSVSFVLNSTTGGQVLVLAEVDEVSGRDNASIAVYVNGGLIGSFSGVVSYLNDYPSQASAVKMFLVNVGAGGNTISAVSTFTGCIITGLLTQR